MSTSVPKSIGKYREIVDEGVREAVTSQQGKLGEMIKYHLDSRDSEGRKLAGKAIRSTLCLFTAEAFGGEAEEALPAAVSLELVHNFSLVHDDIQDDADMRRGKKSVRSMWGEDQAINAGDGLKDLSLLAFSKLDSGNSSQKTVRAIIALTERSLRMVDGQVKDLLYSDRKRITTSEYLDMIGQKTCALLEAAFYLGGLYGGADDELEPLTRLGENLGYVYQIRDDWIGLWGEPERSGKSAEKDLFEKKKTYPVIYALQNARGDSLKRLEEIYGSGGKMDEDQVKRVREILIETEAKKGTEELARGHWEKAEDLISNLSLPKDYLTELRKFGDFLLNREK